MKNEPVISEVFANTEITVQTTSVTVFTTKVSVKVAKVLPGDILLLGRTEVLNFLRSAIADIESSMKKEEQ